MSSNGPGSSSPNASADLMLARPIATLLPDRMAGPSWIGHIPFAFWLMEAQRPERLVELGTSTGNSYCAFLQGASNAGLRPTAFAIGTPEDGLDCDFEALKLFHDPRHGLHSTLLRANLDDAAQTFSDDSIDLLHIDRPAGYDEVRRIFDLWLPKLSENGVVLLHRTQARSGRQGAWRLWEEIAARYPCASFDHSHGLGLAYVGTQPARPALRWLLERATDSEGRAQIRSHFAALGRGLLELHHRRQAEADLAAALAASPDGAADDAMPRGQSIGDLAAAPASQETIRRDPRLANAELLERLEDSSRAEAAQTLTIERLRLQNSRLERRLAEERTSGHHRVAAGIVPPDRRTEELEALVEALHSSTSWRLTRPLRIVTRLMKREMTLGDAVRIWRHRQAGSGRVLPPSRMVSSTQLPQSPSLGMPSKSELDRRYVTRHPDLDPGSVVPLSASISIVIPTFNAGRELPWLIRKLQSQKGVGPIEVVIVDSGSSDGTPEAAEALGCKLVRIPQAEFSHSTSRNLGADNAAGELIVFMVQDAFPVGDHWLYGLADALLRPRDESRRMAALSCAEFSRTDSELLYDALLHGHYEFVGCGDRDRVGSLLSDDQAELRRQGQLSDVACMIPRKLFQEYRYHGRYAEDLTLGIALIQDGHQVGMLSSIRVIHSHRRPAGYYVRRIFVDVIFLAAIFPDFGIPPSNSAAGSLLAAFDLKDRLAPLAPDPDETPARMLEKLVADVRSHTTATRIAPFADRGDFGHAGFGAWIAKMSSLTVPAERELTPPERRSYSQVRSMFADRLQGLVPFVANAYPVLDEMVAAELSESIEKTLAMTLGAQLAFCFLSPIPSLDDDGTDDLVRSLKPLMIAGI